MNKTKRISRILLLFVVGIMAFPKCIFAYIDPGSGSYIIQMMIAVFIGISFAVRVYWKKIKAFLSGVFKKNSGDEN
ncbi:MAG: hypothetical protein KAW19_07045 [Candidatus Aminicenantes bacterium]|nr:hypothetical protein [Candidatus Aminicenantes bacterium]